MGAKDSKRSCLCYEEAVKRMSEAEFKRVCETFKRLTNGGQLLSRQTFTQNVLGDGVPGIIADWLYNACGGNQKGIALRDLLCGLVLLTKGTQEEKIKFLWTLYCNDSGTHITRAEFQKALQTEGTLPPDNGTKSYQSLTWDRTLFGINQDKVNFEDFRAWITYNKEATVLSKWLLTKCVVSLSSELETPTFYQTLAGVTHLEEQDICQLEKCFWAIQSQSLTGHLDLNCLNSLVSPPVPQTACRGLFLALDVNRDDHVDFKELCCGISAACRGPLVERMKFCFKIFDMDRDNHLNSEEVNHMLETLTFIAQENTRHTCTRPVMTETGQKNENLTEINTVLNSKISYSKTLESLKEKMDSSGGLTQEDFLVWSVENNSLLAPLLELLFQVCHVSLGLKPFCRHNEYDIVMGWLQREKGRGLEVGQFWYLISSEWWNQWQTYTTAPKNNQDPCNCKAEPRMPIEEGIVCDESLISNATDYTSNTSNEFNSNSMESMGDLLSRGDSCSIASSSGVSSSSGTGSKKSQHIPGPIDNSNLVSESIYKVPTLTGEGGRLRKDTPLVQDSDFVLVPDSLWKALSLWYGGPLPLPRQVIRQPNSEYKELELFPLNLRILRHQPQQGSVGGGSTNTWSSVVGGYGAAALSTAGISAASMSASPRRYLAYTAAFSRLASIQQVTDFLCCRLNLLIDDARLWHLRDNNNCSLLDDDNATLQDLGFCDSDQLLIEVRNKDQTWPEELGALVNNNGYEVGLSVERRPTIFLPPGATGLHNLGNTCFMNAALQAVSNTRPLTLYFGRDNQLSELNCTNPLGTKGVVARRYAELCRELWAGSTRSVAPLKLRYCVTKHAPHLGGGGQHDSQELLAWLLDSLHEDLNRVAKKQYTELKDSGGRPDEIVAEEAWQQHLNRDHSIITDLFYGQLKSKVTCQTCGHESVRFDPFNLLSLPLPMESYTLCEVLVVKLNGECPVKYGLRLNSEAKYFELKELLEPLCDINPKRLLLVEVACNQIRSLLPDEKRINPSTATELYGYEIPDKISEFIHDDDLQLQADIDVGVPDSPLARSPEVRGGTALCMPNILCFKTNRTPKHESQLTNGVSFKKSTVSIQSQHSYSSGASDGSSISTKSPPKYLIAVHRKCVRQETYFLSQQKSKPSIFGMPLLLGCLPNSTCKGLYEEVWGQVTRLLSPLPQSDQTNHAQDCDDSLGYEFPFTLKTVMKGGQVCAICHWTQFCRGCPLPCTDQQFVDFLKSSLGAIYIAIDWDPTALHLRYQSSREKLVIEHESVMTCRKLHTEPIDLDYCLRAFTKEEMLEAKYHCSNCNDKQPATKKLQIWRLPPILIVHLKRFDCVNNKWVKTQKVVNFPFKDFDPTDYLASVPQETIKRHKQLLEIHSSSNGPASDLENSCDSQKTENAKNEEKIIEEDCSLDTTENAEEHFEKTCTENLENFSSSLNEKCKLLGRDNSTQSLTVKKDMKPRNNRARLVSTSLQKTPIIDANLKDYHEHQLIDGQDPFDLKYQLYAVVSHSGLLNGGHYISYACNPNGNWYCYNDSSCREVLTDADNQNHNSSSNRPPNMHTGCTPLSRRKNLNNGKQRKNSNGSNNSTTESNNSPYFSRRSQENITSTPNSKRKSSSNTPEFVRKVINNTTATFGRNGNSANVSPTPSRRSTPTPTKKLNTENSSNVDSFELHSDALEMSEDLNKKLMANSKDSPYASSRSLFKCPYGEVKTPKIDTSTAYILFYERSGLDYTPYLPKVAPNSTNHRVPPEDLDDSESELRKQQCSIQ